MKRQFLLSIPLLAGLFLSVPAAQAGLFDDDEARRAILDIREKQNKFEATSSDRIEQNSKSMLDLQNQIDALRSDLAKVRGQNEVLQNQLANLQTALGLEQRNQKEKYANIEARLRKLEPQTVVIDGQEGQVTQTEKSAYDLALQQFKDGNYQGSGQGFAEFMQRYPQSVYLPLAQYWYGNALYAQRDYRGSTAQFQALLKASPKHAKAPEAMLGVATNQIESGQKIAARKTWAQIVEQYPNTDAAVTAKDRLANTR